MVTQNKKIIEANVNYKINSLDRSLFNLNMLKDNSISTPNAAFSSILEVWSDDILTAHYVPEITLITYVENLL